MRKRFFLQMTTSTSPYDQSADYSARTALTATGERHHVFHDHPPRVPQLVPIPTSSKSTAPKMTMFQVVKDAKIAETTI